MENTDTENRFSECETPEELMNMIVGAASVCWVTQHRGFFTTERIFDSEKALKVSEEGLACMKTLIYKNILNGIANQLANQLVEESLGLVKE